MKIGDFTRADTTYAFGTDSARAAEALRSLADSIASGDVCLQSARLTSLANNDDFAMTALRLVFAERCDPAGPKRAATQLFGTPVAETALPEWLQAAHATKKAALDEVA